jgi:hypothetical protein
MLLILLSAAFVGVDPSPPPMQKLKLTKGIPFEHKEWTVSLLRK